MPAVIAHHDAHRIGIENHFDELSDGARRKKLRYAVEAWFKPSILDGGDELVDFDSRKPVSREQIRQALKTYAKLFEFFMHLDSGLIHITLQEYLRLSRPIRQAWDVYKATKAEILEHAKTN